MINGFEDAWVQQALWMNGPYINWWFRLKGFCKVFGKLGSDFQTPMAELGSIKLAA